MGIARVQRHAAGTTQLCFHTLVTAAASSDTFGAWTELVASTQEHFAMFQLNWRMVDYGRSVIEIAIGPSGGEVPIASFAYIGNSNIQTAAYSTFGGVTVQVQLPKGQRVSARVKGNLASTTARISLWGIPVSPTVPMGYSRVELHGLQAGPLGTQVSGTNVFGAWTEFIAATTYPAYAVALGISMDSDPTIIMNGIESQIGIGASGQEQILGMERSVAKATDWHAGSWHGDPINIYIPAGSRLSIRARRLVSTTATNLSHLLYVYY